MILTTLLQNNSYYRLTAVIELESTSDILEETTYLDTQSMNIMYSPPYLPDDDIAKNYTSKLFYDTRPAIYVTLKLTSPHHNKCVYRGQLQYMKMDIIFCMIVCMLSYMYYSCVGHNSHWFINSLCCEKLCNPRSHHAV